MRIAISRFVAACCSLAFTCSLLAGNPGSCDADLNFDGTVTGLDLATLLGQWGACPRGADCPADLNDDGQINGLDLAILLGAWGADCSPTIAQLAGNVLTQYPFFEYVRAFNQGAGFHVAVDPTRFPQLVGESCDLYIVAHRTQEQWESDPSLIDLTGSAQTVTITGSTIQANSFAVSGSESLNGTQGTAIGVGYDAVLDCNRNGLLDAADVIDGLHANDEAGLYDVRDTVAPGPFEVAVSPTYSVGTYPGITLGSNQVVQYPTSIDSLEALPLVVISPGAGAAITWYKHIAGHLASFGYVAMTHQENTVVGSYVGSTHTLAHTDAFLDQLSTIAGGALAGHVDASRIVWIGHSRGGEAVVIAYHRLLTGDWTPIHYDANSIRLVISMAPTVFDTMDTTQPHDVPYALLHGGADADLSGCVSSDISQPFRIHDRATGPRHSLYVHGMGHGDFWDSPSSSVATGPCLVGKPASHKIQKGYLLPLVQFHLNGDVAAKDFLTRQWESFKPIGAPAGQPCPPPSGTGVDVVVDLMYRDGPAAGNFMIDDFQANPDTDTSSSGGTVSLSVANLVEGQADDSNTNFTWMTSDPMNGMALGSAEDETRVVAFDWSAPALIEFEVIERQRDFSDDAYLSFRAAQATRHPNTIAALEDLTFDVLLRDGDGVTSRINIGAYGGGIEEPYQRTQCGVGAGWANEFETIRIRLTDFLTNGSGLDLTNIVAVRFEFATPGSESSAVGRIGLDEIEITKD